MLMLSISSFGGARVRPRAAIPYSVVAQRLDASGSLLSSSVYDVYGAESSTATPTDPFGFNGRWGYVADRETGLYYCQNRYYDPSAGRWLDRDPIGAAGGRGGGGTHSRGMFAPPEPRAPIAPGLG